MYPKSNTYNRINGDLNMWRKKALYIIGIGLIIMATCLVVTNKPALYTYNCSYRRTTGQIVDVIVASHNKANVQKTVKSIQNLDSVCKETSSDAMHGSMMLEQYKRDNDKKTNTRFSVIRISTLNTNYYKEILQLDGEPDLIGCNYMQGAYLCTTDIFPNQYTISECPADLIRAKQELPSCIFVDFEIFKL